MSRLLAAGLMLGLLLLAGPAGAQAHDAAATWVATGGPPAAIGQPAWSAHRPPRRGSGQARQVRPRVYLLRGLFNVFSLGMDSLAAKIRAHGIDAVVANHAEWYDLAEALAADRAAGRLPRAIAFVGHSFGGDDIVNCAQELARSGIPVALLIGVDPVSPPPIPGNVRRAVNYWQSNNGFGAPYAAGPGFHGSLVNADIETNRRDLNSGDVGHSTIDKEARVQAAILRDILAMGGGGRRRSGSSGRQADAASRAARF
jgi:hypothetical protein